MARKAPSHTKVMEGTIDVAKFSASVLEGLCRIIEEEMLALYHRLSPTLKQRLQEPGQRTGPGTDQGPQLDLEQGVQPGRDGGSAES